MIRFFTDRPELYNDWRWVWSGPWSQWSLGILAFLLLLALYFSWGSSLRLQLQRHKWTLVGLRLVAAAALWLLLAGPSIELRHVQKIQNFLPIIFDTSGSMRIAEKGDGRSRLKQAKDFLKRNKTLFQKLKDEQKVRFFKFDRKVKSFDGSPKSFEALKADGDETNLLKVAHFLKERYENKALGGVILFTDGLDTLALSRKTKDLYSKKLAQKKSKKKTKGKGKKTELQKVMQKIKAVSKERKQHAARRTSDFIRVLKSLKVPVYTISPPLRNELKDLALAEIYGDTFAFLHNTATIQARVRVVGYRNALLNVNLYREGKLLQTQLLQIREGKRDYLVSFKFKPRKLGKFIYSVQLPMLKGEAVVENNQKSFTLKIIRDRIRVLQVVGRPSWDVRFLRRLLKKNASIDLLSFFILRTHLNPQNVPNRDMSLIPFPSRKLFTKSIFSFDLVVFQNFNFGPYMPTYYLHNIKKFVEKGGAFVMVGGELSFGSGGYLNTPLEQILPVEFGIGQLDKRPFRPVLTEAALHHPITRLSGNTLLSKKLWSSLPNNIGANLLSRARKNSVVLLRHPFLKTDDEKGRPILSVGRYGKGRVMALGVDDSWRWNFELVGKGGTRTPYYRFWNNAIRWLIRDAELERIRVTSFRSSYRLGEKARFRITVLDRQYNPQKGGKVRFRILGVPGKKILFKGTRKLNNRGTVTVSWKPAKAGMYRLHAETMLENNRIAKGEELIEVRGMHHEFQRIQPNTKMFEKLHDDIPKGKNHSFNDKVSSMTFKPPTVVRVDRSNTVELWDNLYVLFFIIGFFAMEWGLRRRWGLA